MALTESCDFFASARPRRIACIGFSFAVSFRIFSLLIGVGSKPSGGCSGLRFGIGIGIGTRVSWFWMNTIGSTPLVGSKLKFIDSTFVNASMSTLSAGCGTPSLISGPKYAMLVPGAGPGSM